MMTKEELSKLKEIIYEKLKAYNLSYIFDELGNGFPLVDRLTPKYESTIKVGIWEIQHLTDMIMDVIENTQKVPYTECTSIPRRIKAEFPPDMFIDFNNRRIPT